MASLRRMNSPLPRGVGSDGDDQEKVHSHLNGANWTANPGSTASPKISGGGSKFFGSVPLIMIASGIQSLHQISKTSERSFKSKRRRCVVQVLVFFLVGLFWGFSPFGSVDVLLKRTDLSLGHPRIGEIESKRLSSQDLRFQGFVGLEEEKVLDNDQTDRNSAFPKLDLVPKKFLIIVTPTYNRAFQSFYLNRLGHTLRLVPPPLLWILVEIGAQSPETAEILRKSGVMYRHLVSSNNLTNIKDRGVNQRNTALEHIRTHRLDGIVYFADDDNLYSLELFEQIRGIRRFGTWPVAMLAQSKAKAIMEGPVCKGSEVIGWHTNEKSKRLRRFHVDMSGFAFNSTILWDPKRWQRLDPDPIQQLDSVKEGFQETTFIAQLVEDESQMEGLPNNCSKVMAWHLHMENSGLDYPTGWFLKRNLDAVVPL